MSNFRRGNLCQVGQRTKHGQQLRKIFLRIYKNQYLFKTLNPKKIATTLRTANIFSKKLMSQLFQFHNSNFLSQFCPRRRSNLRRCFYLRRPGCKQHRHLVPCLIRRQFCSRYQTTSTPHPQLQLLPGCHHLKQKMQ